MRADEIDDLRLERVSVLVFVHEHVPEAVGEIGRGLGGLLEEFEPVFEEVVVIDNVGGAFRLRVFFREERRALDDPIVLRKKARDDLVERELRVAGHGQQRVQRAGARMGLVLEECAVAGLDGVAQHALGFLGVENGERPRQADGLAMHPQRAMPD